MEMFLMALALALLGVGVSAVLFAAATREERQIETSSLDERLVSGAPQRFFSSPAPGWSVRKPSDLPAEVLLLMLEQHIRLEQAAAESFHQSPTPESLHTRTTSPLVVH